MSEVRRCEFIKPDGVQCGSPALRKETHCYFHDPRRQNALREASLRQASPFPMGVPDLENANAIQGALTEVMRLLIADQIDNRRAGLLLYALQTASHNLRQLWYADPEEDLETRPEVTASVDDLLTQIRNLQKHVAG